MITGLESGSFFDARYGVTNDARGKASNESALGQFNDMSGTVFISKPFNFSYRIEGFSLIIRHDRKYQAIRGFMRSIIIDDSDMTAKIKRYVGLCGR